MKHLYEPVPRPKKGKGSRGPFVVRAKCEAPLRDDDELVDAALESDCDDCRTRAKVALKGDKTWDGRAIGVKQHPVYEPQPVWGEGRKKV